ncbi:hypothetical protein QD712_07475 [Streptomyces acidiscabies]|uniref:trypco2 family protein n=1 Tax=Streptomyces acidiscabies TaxID=42234 RepID=UPI0030CB24B7
MPENENIELATMIHALRESLGDAQREGERTTGPRFQVKDVELEATVQVVKDKQATGGVRFWLVGVQGNIGRTNCVTQRMKILLSPEERTLVSDSGGDRCEFP